MPIIDINLLNNATDKQKMRMRIGLLQYAYIMSHFNPMDEDFRDVFNDFYLSSKPRMRRPGNRIPFFETMQEVRQANNIFDISDLVDILKERLELGTYEFSFATKLLHTVCNYLPIYDSKVRNYLKRYEHVDFWLYYQPIEHVEVQILHDWQLLKEWYRDFMKTQRCHEWIEWFDSNFPEYAYISSVKKIDFIIFIFNQ